MSKAGASNARPCSPHDITANEVQRMADQEHSISAESVLLPPRVRKKDLTGKRFGHWLVLCYGGSRRSPITNATVVTWLCRCDCGKEKVIRADVLRNGSPASSCGCARGKNREKHGHNKKGRVTCTYHKWTGMIQRCYNPKATKYKDYGARGITVCDAWRYSFSQFLADMGEAPAGMTIDRINNDGPYEKSNCRWATLREQANNRRGIRLKLITFEGKTASLSEWARVKGFSAHLLSDRLTKLGWSIEKALTTPCMAKYAPSYQKDMQ